MSDRIQLAFGITRAIESADGLLVEGVLVEEQLDKYGKIIDYAASKPHIEAWRDEVRALSGGQSDGNVRVMHQLWPCGKIVPGGLTFDDATKQVWARAKIIEPDAQALVLEGVLTTFSIGADIKKRWADPEQPKIERLAIAPVEMSLVDNPGQYREGAGFEIQRASGAVEQIPFKAMPGPRVALSAATITSVTALQAKATALLTTLRAAGALDTVPLARPECVRGLWDVGRLADLVQSLSYLTDSAAAERDAEGDASAIPDRLAALVTELGDILVAMTAEEVSELTERFQPDAATTVTFAAGTPTDPTRRAVQLLALGGDALRVTLHPRTVRRAQKMHDFSCELGATCADESDDTIARAAAPSAPAQPEEGGDMTADELKAAMPELARALAPSLGEEVQRAVTPVQAAVEATKATVTAQAEQIAALTRTIEAQDARLKAVEAAPAAPTGVTRVVDKGADDGAPAVKALDASTANPIDVMRAVIARQPIAESAAH